MVIGLFADESSKLGGLMGRIGHCLAALGYAIGFVGRALNLLLVDERGGAVRGQQAGLHQDPHATLE